MIGIGIGIDREREMVQQKLRVGVERIVDVKRGCGSEREGGKEGERDTAMRTGGRRDGSHALADSVKLGDGEGSCQV